MVASPQRLQCGDGDLRVSQPDLILLGDEPGEPAQGGLLELGTPRSRVAGDEGEGVDRASWPISLAAISAASTCRRWMARWKRPCAVPWLVILGWPLGRRLRPSLVAARAERGARPLRQRSGLPSLCKGASHLVLAWSAWEPGTRRASRHVHHGTFRLVRQGTRRPHRRIATGATA